mgnify:CR=1 FL=1
MLTAAAQTLTVILNLQYASRFLSRFVAVMIQVVPVIIFMKGSPVTPLVQIPISRLVILAVVVKRQMME